MTDTQILTALIERNPNMANKQIAELAIRAGSDKTQTYLTQRAWLLRDRKGIKVKSYNKQLSGMTVGKGVE